MDSAEERAAAAAADRRASWQRFISAIGVVVRPRSSLRSRDGRLRERPPPVPSDCVPLFTSACAHARTRVLPSPRVCERLGFAGDTVRGSRRRLRHPSCPEIACS